MELRWPRTGVARMLCFASILGSACGFEHGQAAVSDAYSADTPPDIKVPSVFASCSAIHAGDPSAATGMYMIDPDGDGGDAPIEVVCDMATAPGGWTIVFLAPSANIMTIPASYTSATPRLLADATTALLAYRSSTYDAAANYATFPLPASWRTDAPMNAAMTDEPVSASINGGAAVVTTLRYGFQSFTGYCIDPWLTNLGPWGRICLTGTQAPFFAGFDTSSSDTCSDSASEYSAAPCSVDRRFSIAVR